MENDLGVSDAKPQEGRAPEAKESVSYETHKKLLSQRKRDQDELSTLRDELNSFKSTQQQLEDSKLKEQGEYKKLLDQREKELNEVKSQFGDWKTHVVTSEKLRAFEKHLPGKIKSDEYLNFVDTEKILINPESGSVDEESIKSVVGEFMEKHGESLVIRQDIGKLPAGSAPILEHKPKTAGKLSSNEIETELREAFLKKLQTNRR